MSKEDLIPFGFDKRTADEQQEIATKGGIASGKARRQKKLMSELYGEFLEKEYEIEFETGEKEKLSGHAFLSFVMMKILRRGDAASVSLIREVRQATEGDKLRVDVPDISITVKFTDGNTGRTGNTENIQPATNTEKEV